MIALSRPLVATGGGSGNTWAGAYSSWASGMVIPDGAKLAGGGVVSWSSGTNLTALVCLPNITMPDGITYLVLSAMGSDRTVFQIALGIWPGTGHWSVYSWFITDVDSRSPAYAWVANGSAPQMSPSDLVSVTLLLRQPGVWSYSIADHRTADSRQGRFAGASASSFASGDQEVLSFESYSRSSSTFRDMGNLTVESIYFDGIKVLGGWYSYSGWDPSHNPLFIVGNSALPPFISFAVNAQGQAMWSYSPPWSDVSDANGVAAPIITGAAAVVFVTCLSFALSRSSKGSRPARI